MAIGTSCCDLCALRRERGGEPELAEPPVNRLTDRELEVFELIGTGLGAGEFAERFCLSPKTIDAHRQKIKRKLDLASTSKKMRYAVKWVLDQSRGQP